ncbi:MAG: dinitrogenase iron-molybdenum cofactor biosynthesis protein [Oceanospirillaceae bacterium]|nr:dinitrogenase iron-molybdenum cofactor biosynthesis protein [Oceanospirillaceae bacterium]MBT11105.1 dinitrogenase iron-molybdenum cofactor biosynthesis protein [Oceanospirillaceae bacterium]
MPNISRDAALRIAMAARAIPDVSVGQLLEIIARRIEGDLTEEALTTITVTDLKTGFGSVDGEEDGEDISAGLANIKDAVRILWGEAEEDNLPAAVASAGDMPDSVRVAIASNNGEILNGHFGSCLRFLVYQLNASDCQLIDVRSTVDADLAEDRNDFRAALIGDCQILYVQSIGGPAAAKVVRTGIYPIKQKTSENARDVLGRLQQVMQTSPPPWLAKILGASAEERIRFAQEG